MNPSAADGPSSATPRSAPFPADLNQEDNRVVLPKEEVTVPRLKPFLVPELNVDDATIEAIVSMTHRHYKRARLSDGSFRPETYIFSKQTLPTGIRADPSVDRLSWNVLTAKISAALAQQNYFLADSPNSAQLRIKIQWGSSELVSDPPPFPTIVSIPSPSKIQEQSAVGGAGAPGAARRMRLSFGKSNWAREDVDSRSLVREPSDTPDHGQNEPDYDELVGFPDQNARYFVVLSAFENTSRTPRVPLWETHFSVEAHGNWFDAQLPALAFTASDFFGQDSNRIVLKPLTTAMIPRPTPAVNSSAARLAKRKALLAPDGAHVAFLRELAHTQQIVVVSISSSEHLLVGEISQNNEIPLNMRWEDSAHVLISKTETTSMRFDLAKKRAELLKNNSQPALQNLSEKSPLVSFSEVQKIAEEKLPDREVTILEADDASRRFLLLASPKTSAGRYFVFDRPSDLLYEVGREEFQR